MSSSPSGVRAASVRCLDDDRGDEAAAIRRDLAFLAAPDRDGRAPGSPGDLATRRYVSERFRCLGVVPAGDGDSYEQPFVAAEPARGGSRRDTANLVGYVRGDDPVTGGDIIVVGAHHDHLGGGYLGANDNASGVAALLAIARAVTRRGPPHRTIAFVAFGGEELGLVGSTYFAAHPPAALPLDRVVYDVNLDMVGSYASAGAVYAMGTFVRQPATAIVRALAAKRPALHIALGGRGADSDHEAFCRAGIPYVFFWTPDPQCYHARCDTVDRADTAHLIAIAALAGDLTIELSKTPDLAGSRRRLGCGQTLPSHRP